MASFDNRKVFYYNLFCHMFQYGVYRELRFPDDDDEEDEEEGRSDTAEVREYALLVGEKVWRRMLLYRS
jgi:hypothetical protein